MKKEPTSPTNKIKLSPFTAIIGYWRVLFIAFLAGGLIGAAVYVLLPPPYRAMAVVVMDQNLEQVFPAAPDREIFYFLEREIQKLEELAWSDEVIQPVADLSGTISVSELRGGVLQLSQPADGGWRMYALSNQPDTARRLVNAWSESFVQAVEIGVTNARKLQQVQAELDQVLIDEPGNTDRINTLNVEVTELTASSYGIHPEIEVFRSQKSDLTVDRKISQGAYIFGGAVVGLIGCILFLALTRKTNG